MWRWGVWGALGKGIVGHRSYEREKMDALTGEGVNTRGEVRKDK